MDGPRRACSERSCPGQSGIVFSAGTAPGGRTLEKPVGIEKPFQGGLTPTIMRNLLAVLLLNLTYSAAAFGAGLPAEDSIEKLRDRQDRAALDARAAALHADAEKAQKDADKWYRSAVA